MRDWLQRRVEIPLLCWLLPVPRGGAVLELGCGKGNAFGALRSQLRPTSLTGVDRNGAVLVYGPATRVVAGDVRALPFATSSFDVVVDFGTCQHAGETSLEEVFRVLRPGGVFVHETALAQRLAHPTRPRGALDWSRAPGLTSVATASLWSVRLRVGAAQNRTVPATFAS